MVSFLPGTAQSIAVYCAGVDATLALRVRLPLPLDHQPPCRYGDEEALEDFIAIGKDINEADKEGRTALHYATAFNQPTCASMLLSE